MRGEAIEHVPKIKAAPGKELLVIGSTHLTANWRRPVSSTNSES